MARGPTSSAARARRAARSGVLSSGAMTVSGFAELEAKLAELPNNIAKNATVRAMRRAGNLMADEQRQRAPVGPAPEGGKFPKLADSIVVKARSRNLTGLAEYSAVLNSGGGYRDAQSAMREARRGDSTGSRVSMIIGSVAPHAHLVEFGTVERFHKSGKSVGVMPAEPFIRPAFDAKKGAVLQAIKSELAAEIERTTARLARKAAKGS